MSLFADAELISLTGPSSARSGCFWFRVSAASRCFDGHFEDLPILPGVAHIALALEACARNLDRRELAGLRDVRFMRPLGPGDDVEVVLIDGTVRDSVRFEIRRNEELASSGVLLFAHDGFSS